MIQQVYISSDIRESFNSVQPYLSNLCIHVIVDLIIITEQYMLIH